jgi:DNA-binding MarR family transcriptional regulator
MATPDLLDSSFYRPLFALLAEMDRAIAELYAARGVARVSTRFVGPLISLASGGAMSVKELAAAREVTHSAMSQTVSAMKRAGFVAVAPGPDARTRLVSLTESARAHIPLLMAEWRATEATVRELDAELPHPIMGVVGDLRAALQRRPFSDRLEANLRVQLAAGSREADPTGQP